MACRGWDVLVRVLQPSVAAEQKNIPMYSLCIAAVAAFSVRVQLCMFENGFEVNRVCLFCVTEGSLPPTQWMKKRTIEGMNGRSSENRCSFLPGCGEEDR